MAFTVQTRTIKQNNTSVLVQVYMDNGTGSPATGLTVSTNSVTLYYKRDTANASANVALTDSATLGTWTSGGFKEVDSTHMPGVYEIGLPNAALASGANKVFITIRSTISATANGIIDVTLGSWDFNETGVLAAAVLSQTLGSEAYAAVNTVPTLAQMLFMLWSQGAQFSITGTTITAYKLDGSTPSMTFTLNSSSTPTSTTRAT